MTTLHLADFILETKSLWSTQKVIQVLSKNVIKLHSLECVHLLDNSP